MKDSFSCVVEKEPKTEYNLIEKLKTMKPIVDFHCPESFAFYKTSFHAYKTQPNTGNKKYI